MENFDWGRIVGKALGAGLLIAAIYLGMWLWGVATKAGRKGVAIGKDAIDHARDRIDGIPDSGSRYDALYAKAYAETQAASFDPASWAKALASSAGENEKAKALYIKYRVEQLKEQK